MLRFFPKPLAIVGAPCYAYSMSKRYSSSKWYDSNKYGGSSCMHRWSLVRAGSGTEVYVCTKCARRKVVED